MASGALGGESTLPRRPQNEQNERAGPCVPRGQPVRTFAGLGTHSRGSAPNNSNVRFRGGLGLGHPTLDKAQPTFPVAPMA